MLGLHVVDLALMPSDFVTISFHLGYQVNLIKPLRKGHHCPWIHVTGT
jgi:hypothetical protein